MILIVGSVHITTSKYHKILNLPESKLFVGQSIQENHIYHTSLADCKDLVTHLHKFKKIYWAQSKINEFENFNEYFETLYMLKNFGEVVGISKDPYNIGTKHHIENNENNAIFFGCSHTVGGYLRNNDDDYTNIITKHFNLQTLNLAGLGKSNFGSFDLFEQIEYYTNQIVVLQLTDFTRLRYFSSDSQDSFLSEESLSRIDNKSYFEVFNNKHLIYLTLSRLNSIVRFARASKLKFIFFNTDTFANEKYSKIIEYYLLDYPEYIPNLFENNFRKTKIFRFDVQFHKTLANQIITKIEEIYS
jgi:hypothetical protein